MAKNAGTPIGLLCTLHEFECFCFFLQTGQPRKRKGKRKVDDSNIVLSSQLLRSVKLFLLSSNAVAVLLQLVFGIFDYYCVARNSSFCENV